MGISQPAVSKLLRQAEAALGLSVMVRDGGRVTPTQEAEAVRDGIERLFGAYDALRHLAASLQADDAGTISVAAIPTQAVRFVIPTIRQLRAEQPGTQVRLRVLSNRATLNDVASGQADFGLVHSIMPAPEMRTEDVGEQTVLCIAPQGHRFGRLHAVSCRDMAGETYVSYGRHSAFNRWLEQAFQREKSEVPSAIEITASPALIEAVRLGIGVGLIESAALPPEMRRRLTVRPFEPELRLASRIVRRPGHPLSRPRGTAVGDLSDGGDWHGRHMTLVIMRIAAKRPFEKRLTIVRSLGARSKAKWQLPARIFGMATAGRPSTII